MFNYKAMHLSVPGMHEFLMEMVSVYNYWVLMKEMACMHARG